MEVNTKQNILEFLLYMQIRKSKPEAAPMEENYLKEGNEEPLTDDQQYKEATESLLYIVKLTRLDESPSKRDWNAMKRLARYFDGTAHLKLKIFVNDNAKLMGYMDADWAGDTTKSKSTIYFCMGMELSAGPVENKRLGLYSSQKQSLICNRGMQTTKLDTTVNTEL